MESDDIITLILSVDVISFVDENSGGLDRLMLSTEKVEYGKVWASSDAIEEY
jgi:hypothetical protein